MHRVARTEQLPYTNKGVQAMNGASPNPGSGSQMKKEFYELVERAEKLTQVISSTPAPSKKRPALVRPLAAGFCALWILRGLSRQRRQNFGTRSAQ